jgi:hypothetical protein
MIQHTTTTANSSDDLPYEIFPAEGLDSQTSNSTGIREKLRKWQELHGHEDPAPELPLENAVLDEYEPYNGLSPLSDETVMPDLGREENEQDQNTYYGSFGKEGFEGAAKEQIRFMKPGDLVEINTPKNERESMLAIYIRKVGFIMGQYFTIQGRWVHLPDSAIMYSVRGWVDPKQLEHLTSHLPNPQTSAEMEALLTQAYSEDLSVPREVSGPIVERLIAFEEESQAMYRRHANALDNAHDILAHATDLRYGSLESAASVLLKMPVANVSPTALYTVRKAVDRGGFAFNIDRRSHRVTGYMQIRSKQQVETVERVRTWIREWQEDLAQQASLDARRAAKYKPSEGAQVLGSFIRKAKAFVEKQRQERTPDYAAKNIGISQSRRPISKEQGAVWMKSNADFSREEQEIVKFLEGWCCSNLYLGFNRLEALPPLIIHATGLYEGVDIEIGIGWLFLQEIGTILPYENRVRFDPHLLLPSSQHSKPLQNLMSKLLAMHSDPDLEDTMADLRHDWGDMPVYCIDDAGAREIDDGISIESAGPSPDGKEQYWLHIHIANPTAFFQKDHPLAKMARHMGETIYMPERVFPMLPNWATRRLFSLAPNRPCLTFSARLDSEGNVREFDIKPGLIRNVLHITYSELEDILGFRQPSQTNALVFRVGGEAPPPPPRESVVPRLTPENIRALKTLQEVALARSELRKRNGGIFFEQNRPEVTVWQSWHRTGLDATGNHRLGFRGVFGDPVIEIRTEPLQNWFAATREAAQRLVSESMLLCSEIASKFCWERKIPIIYRGSVQGELLDKQGDVLKDGAELLKQGKELPMWLGMRYLKMQGHTVLRTEPLKHNFIGMDAYAKVTSPLRRYGDMIVHWQIEAALRHEARTGKSLSVPQDMSKRAVSKLDRSFLPFSAPTLETIMVGLQPRELMITRSKRYSTDHWITQLIFRMHHCKESGGFPFETFQVFIDTNQTFLTKAGVQGLALEFNIVVWVLAEDGGNWPGGDVPRQGDIWEVRLGKTDVYRREIFTNAVRLVARNAM